MNIYYVIEHISTGKLFPIRPSKHYATLRGSTHWEPEEDERESYLPRLYMIMKQETLMGVP